MKLLTTLGPSRANVDQQSNSEDTALHLASQYGYCGVVEFLLEVRGERGGRERRGGRKRRVRGKEEEREGREARRNGKRER